jgi:hypothetical protein
MPDKVSVTIEFQPLDPDSATEETASRVSSLENVAMSDLEPAHRDIAESPVTVVPKGAAAHGDSRSRQLQLLSSFPTPTGTPDIQPHLGIRMGQTHVGNSSPLPSLPVIVRNQDPPSDVTTIISRRAVAVPTVSSRHAFRRDGEKKERKRSKARKSRP